MQLVKTDYGFPTEINTWSAVRYFVGMSIRLKQADLACQVMAGFALQELKSTNEIRPGRPAKNPDPEKLPINSVISDSSDPSAPSDRPTVRPSDRLSWPDLVKREAGISDDTARNWMRMATGIKKKWQNLPIRERLSALMSVSPSQWTEDDVSLISNAVHKVTDGRTQLEFMWENGLAKKPASNRGNKPGQGGRPKDLDIDGDDDEDELLKEFRQDMVLFTHDKDDTLRKSSTSILTQHLAEAEQYVARIRAILAKRKSL